MKKFNIIYSYIIENGLVALCLKTADFFLNSFGISLISYKNIKKRDFKINPYTGNLKKNYEIFSDIYANEYWLNGNSVSGIGSELINLKNYRKHLNKFVSDYNIKSIFDIPCGDFIFMNDFLKNKKIKYLGGDIVEKLIKKNNDNFSNYNFIIFDLLKDKLEEYFEVVHIKDCLFHFSISDVKKTLNNIVLFNSKYTLITSHKSILLKNVDIKTGEFRILDLEKEPFCLPKPMLRLKDFQFKFRTFPKYICVWKTEDLRKHLIK